MARRDTATLAMVSDPANNRWFSRPWVLPPLPVKRMHRPAGPRTADFGSSLNTEIHVWRRWVEPAWLPRLDAIRDKLPDKRRPGAVPTARRPLIKTAISSAINSRLDDKTKARRAAERLFRRAGAA